MFNWATLTYRLQASKLSANRLVGTCALLKGNKVGSKKERKERERKRERKRERDREKEREKRERKKKGNKQLT